MSDLFRDNLLLLNPKKSQFLSVNFVRTSIPFDNIQITFGQEKISAKTQPSNSASFFTASYPGSSMLHLCSRNMTARLVCLEDTGSAWQKEPADCSSTNVSSSLTCITVQLPGATTTRSLQQSHLQLTETHAIRAITNTTNNGPHHRTVWETPIYWSHH